MLFNFERVQGELFYSKYNNSMIVLSCTLFWIIGFIEAKTQVVFSHVRCFARTQFVENSQKIVFHRAEAQEKKVNLKKDYRAKAHQIIEEDLVLMHI